MHVPIGQKKMFSIVKYVHFWGFCCRPHRALLKLPIDLFSLYVLFSHFRPRDATRGNSFFQMSSYARANVRITNAENKRQIPMRASRGLKWENKTYKLKRSISELEQGRRLRQREHHLHVVSFLDYSKPFGLLNESSLEIRKKKGLSSAHVVHTTSQLVISRLG